MRLSCNYRLYYVLLMLIGFTSGLPLAAQTQKLSPNAGPGIAVPMRYDPLVHGLPMIPLRLNGGQPLWFVVDCGAVTPLQIEPWAAEPLGLKGNGGIVTVTDKNGDVAKKGYVADLTTAEIIDAKNQPLLSLGWLRTAYVIDFGHPHFYDGPRPAGLLGAPFFAHHTICFDFAAATMTVTAEAHAPLKIAGATTVAMQPQEDGRWTVPVRINEMPVDLWLDTGGDFGVVLPETVVRTLGVTPKPSLTTTLTNVRGTTDYRIALLPQLHVGNRAEPNIIVYISSDAPLAMLGVDFLSRFRVTLDARNQQMHMEPARDYTDRVRLPGSYDLLLAFKDGHHLVNDVLPDSPAEQAGVSPGDEITAVDGRPLTALTEDLAHTLITGLAGTTATLTLRREGKTRVVRYERTGFFDPSSDPAGQEVGTGIVTALTADRRCYITQVLPHSPAEKAGLKPGDEIISINGLALKDVTLQQLTTEVDKPEGSTITVTVRREGEEKPREVPVQITRLTKAKTD